MEEANKVTYQLGAIDGAPSPYTSLTNKKRMPVLPHKAATVLAINRPLQLQFALKTIE